MVRLLTLLTNLTILILYYSIIQYLTISQLLEIASKNHNIDLNQTKGFQNVSKWMNPSGNEEKLPACRHAVPFSPFKGRVHLLISSHKDKHDNGSDSIWRARSSFNCFILLVSLSFCLSPSLFSPPLRLSRSLLSSLHREPGAERIMDLWKALTPPVRRQDEAR